MFGLFPAVLGFKFTIETIFLTVYMFPLQACYCLRDDGTLLCTFLIC